MPYDSYNVVRLYSTYTEVDNGDGTNRKNVTGSGYNGTMVLSLTATNDDDIDHVVNLLALVGANYFQIGSVTVPAGAGYGGVANVDMIAAIDPNARNLLRIDFNTSLYCSLDVAMTAGKLLHLTCVNGEF